MSPFLRTSSVAFVALALVPTAAQEAHQADGADVDALVSATYDVISGSKGEARDWDRFRRLFAEGAFMVPRTDEAGAPMRRITPDDYVARSGPYLEGNGFFEEETDRRVRVYGDVAQVFSAYAARHTEDDAEPFMRGVNAFQLVHDGERWWIVSLVWHQEGEDTPLPGDLSDLER